MSDHDVPDSTDWLSTPLAGLAAVEGALRCQVCKDFFKTPMITSCCHTFCSLCIRRALSNDGKCPLCRTSEQELKLRSNWSMEETVEAFVKARVTTLDLARNKGTENATSKRKAEDDHHESDSAPEGKRLRSSARLRKSRPDTDTSPYTTPTEYDEVVEVPDDDDYEPEPEDGLVACPVCQSRMKEWQVFKHLETCTGPTPPPPQRKATSSSTPSFGQQRQQSKAPDRLPTLNYSMFRDQALRKKMSELGISNQGPRALLERRHKEWMTLWNANCDGVRPKKRHELLHDLDVWERTQGGRAPTTGRAVQNAAVIKDKDFDGAAWATKHDTSFKDLIANARKSRLEAKEKAEEGSKEPGPEVSASATLEGPSSIEQPQTLPPQTLPPTSSTTIPNVTYPDYPGHLDSTPAALPKTTPETYTATQPQPAVSLVDRVDPRKQPLYTTPEGVPQQSLYPHHDISINGNTDLRTQSLQTTTEGIPRHPPGNGGS
ncbi:hypothetical protein FZEAL_6908 [Fusarium zealandicum]|uniref:Postreplication repair E3 ubiquitin-protein ligase RAD18 n=1 Tax=Fusarium zealandicum TaxID=1053134 RepID=A0A8H4XJE5_9HYPO|nr:hypothetical protein FZEAL_6908 [Fusarium zealandicum]